MLKIREKDIQKSITDYLDLRGDIYYIRNNSFAGRIMRGNGSWGWIKNSKAGSPDLVLCIQGKWVGCELKVKNGRQSDLQKDAEVKIRKSGGIYFIAHSLEEFIGKLENLTLD